MKHKPPQRSNEGPRVSPAARAGWLLAAVLLGTPLRAEWRGFETPYDPERPAWQEAEVAPPAYPQPANLVAFEVSAASRHRHFLDQSSLSVGPDGVVRYTVVIRTAGGAEQVFFEGMRCDTGEVKRYAFGRPGPAGGGEWQPNRQARWEAIPGRVAASYQRELFYHYLCTVEGKGDLTAIRRYLHQGGFYRDSERNLP